jgi:hypothetical protein
MGAGALGTVAGALGIAAGAPWIAAGALENAPDRTSAMLASVTAATIPAIAASSTNAVRSTLIRQVPVDCVCSCIGALPFVIPCLSIAGSGTGGRAAEYGKGAEQF